MSVPSLTRFKRCTKCVCTKIASTVFFHKHKLGRYGLATRCKCCDLETRRLARKGREVALAARSREWRERNTEHVAEYQRLYYETNREEYLVRDRARREKTRGAQSQRHQRYYEANKERWRVYESQRRARKLNQGGIPYTLQDIRAMREEQHGRCYYCDDTLVLYHIEHKVPLSRGGIDGLENICLSCAPCNKKKYTKTEEEFRGSGCNEPEEFRKVTGVLASGEKV